MTLKAPRKPDEENEDAWLITYADMVTLLLCFFIILFAMSAPDTEQLKKVADAMRKEGFYNALAPADDPYSTLKDQLSISLGESGFDKFVGVTETPKEIELELASTSFFEPGSAKFRTEALPVLTIIAEQVKPLASKNIQLEVDGHTDDVPIATAQFPSNWELSAARAANVVRYLVANGFPARKLKAVGYGETRPKAPNRDSKGNALPANQEINRRVVVKIVKGEAY